MQVYQYGDYRSFIRDYFAARKARDPNYSLARLGQRAGLSKVAVKYVMDGRRHIALDTAARWATCLELSKDEAAFFEQLVLFNKARSHKDRSLQFQKLMAMQGRALSTRLLEGSESGYFQAWYYPAIAELSYLDGFVAEPAWIKPRLRFPVASGAITKALQYLSAHGYLKGHAPKAAKVKTPDEVASHVYKAFVIEQCERAAAAIAEQAKADREVFTLTVSIDEARYAAVKERIAAIRHELHDLCANHDPATRVVQINLQMFTVASESSL